MKNKIIDILKEEYPEELVKRLVDIYYKSICEYRKNNWQYFGNEVGRFIEIAIRIIEFKTEGKYNELKDRLPIFDERRLKDFEQSKISKNVSFRILIPRQLYSMYTIRNKRGMIHVNEINPNYMDATLMISMEKWVLAEFVRNASNLDYEEVIKMINDIVAKENVLVWIDEDIFKVLDNNVTLDEKILCILYYKNNVSEKELFKLSNYSNISVFRKKLILLDKECKINYNVNKITISPIGINIVEKKLNEMEKTNH